MAVPSENVGATTHIPTLTDLKEKLDNAEIESAELFICKMFEYLEAFLKVEKRHQGLSI